MSRLTNLPNPPPGAHPVQLELWRRVLHRRYRQIEALSPSTFNLFASGVASDYENSLLENSQMDLSKSHYSSFLLPRRGATDAVVVDDNSSNNNNTAKQIAVHLLGLFYTAIDERISPPERQFAIDIVKRDFSLLDDLLKGKDRTEDNNSDSGDDYVVVGKHGRDEEEEEEEKEEHIAAEMPKKKHARKDPPRVDDTSNTGLLESGDIQNSQSDRSNEEGEHEREKSNNITSTVDADEGGETVASSGPSASISKHHEAEEGAADEMQVDESNDDLEIATHKNNDGAEEVTADDDGGEGEKLGTSLNISEPDVLQNKGDSGADDDSGVRGTKSSMPSQDLSLEGIDDDERTSEFSTNAAEPLPSKEGDKSIEEAVAAHDDVARPAESGTLQDETQLKEPIEASGSGCAAKALAGGESGTHSEVEDTDEVMETEAVRTS